MWGFEGEEEVFPIFFPNSTTQHLNLEFEQMELLYVNYIFKFLKQNWAQRTVTQYNIGLHSLPLQVFPSSLLQITVHQGKREYSNIQ